MNNISTRILKKIWSEVKIWYTTNNFKHVQSSLYKHRELQLNWKCMSISDIVHVGLLKNRKCDSNSDSVHVPLYWIDTIFYFERTLKRWATSNQLNRHDFSTELCNGSSWYWSNLRARCELLILTKTGWYKQHSTCL